MNYSDYNLHGISPFYDQTIFVRCHLCRNIVKLPQLADHLDQRHSISNNDSNDTQLTTNETFNSKVLNNQNSTSVNYNNNNNSNITNNNNNKKARNNTKSTVQLDTTQLGANELITKPKTFNTKIKNKNTKILEQTDLTNQTAEEQPKINQVVEKIKSKIINAKKLTEQQQTNDYKSLPKLIIKKDKNSSNNECFYLNNVQASSQQSFHYIEPQQSNNDLNNLQTDDLFKHNSSSQSSLINSNTKTISSNKSSKNYDPNKHCGVVVETFDPLTNQLMSKEPCTRSLSCKKHSINSRRAVTGRYKSFNELFNEYRDEKSHQTDDLNVNNEQQLNKSRTKINRKKQSQQPVTELIQLEKETNNVTNDFNNQSELSQIQINNDYNHSAFMRKEPTQTNNTNTSTINTKFNTNRQQIPAPFLPPAELNSTNLNENLIKLNLNFSNSMLAKHHPRPSAVTSFNARLTDSGGGYTLWNRKQDNLRLILSNAFSQTSNYLDKNRCFTTGSTDTTSLEQNQVDQSEIDNSDQFVYNQSFQNNELIDLNGIKIDESYKLNKKRNTQFESNNQKMKKTKVINSNEEVLVQSSPSKIAKQNGNSLRLSLENGNGKHKLNLNDSKDLGHFEKINQLSSFDLITHNFSNTKEKTLMLNGNHGQDNNHHELTTCLKYPITNAFVPMKNPTLNNFLLGHDDEDDDEIIETTPSFISKDNSTLNQLSYQSYLKLNDKTVNRKQTKSVSLSPSPSSSSSSSSTISSINQNGTNTNAYLLNTIN